MKAILGTKIGMTQVFTTEGKLIPVTVVHAEPNRVLEIKTKDKHGYEATKLGYLTVSEKSMTKPKIGEFKKVNSQPKRFIKEVRNMKGYELGKDLSVSDVFELGEYIDVQATSKGHGFTGAIKRWNFKIGPMGHGAGYPHRFQGSVAKGRGGSQAQRVLPGQKMSGHYGHETVTIQNLTIVDIVADKNLVLISGTIPGPKNGLVIIKQAIKKGNQKTKYEMHLKVDSNYKKDADIKVTNVDSTTSSENSTASEVA